MKKNLIKNYQPTETRLKNIERKVRILDRDTQFYNDIPIPSWIELNVIDACNRSCSFCPKSDPEIAPNTYLKMKLELVEKLCSDLKKIDFDGAFCLSGYGEPTLHNELHVVLGAGYSRSDITIFKAADYGAAMISEKHCNFIVNLENSTARQIEELGEKLVVCVSKDSNGNLLALRSVVLLGDTAWHLNSSVNSKGRNYLKVMHKTVL